MQTENPPIRLAFCTGAKKATAAKPAVRIVQQASSDGWTEIASISDVPSPSFLTYSHRFQMLYAASERPEGEGLISALSVGSDGQVQLRGQKGTAGQGAVHVGLAANGLYVANYGSPTADLPASVAAFSLSETGNLGERLSAPTHRGSGPDKARQAGPHCHAVVPTPHGAYLAAVDLGTDRIIVYRIVTGGLVRSYEIALAPGCGPRHLVFHPSLPLAYVTAELSSEILVLDWVGKRAVIARQPATGQKTKSRNYPSGLALSPDARFLYVANRGADTVDLFGVDPADGALRHLQAFAAGGRFPRSLKLSADGALLAVANQASGDVQIFARNVRDGSLTPFAAPAWSGAPVFDIAFIEV